MLWGLFPQNNASRSAIEPASLLPGNFCRSFLPNVERPCEDSGCVRPEVLAGSSRGASARPDCILESICFCFIPLGSCRDDGHAARDLGFVFEIWMVAILLNAVQNLPHHDHFPDIVAGHPIALSFAQWTEVTIEVLGQPTVLQRLGG
jgi:hypothetical protein